MNGVTTNTTNFSQTDRTVGLRSHTEDHRCTPDNSLTLTLKPVLNSTYPTSPNAALSLIV